LPLSEPEATIRFTNKRTGDSVDATVTEDCSLEVGLTIGGVAGDEVTVAVSDGEGNQDFDVIAGTLVIEQWPELAPVEPSPMNRDGGAEMEEVEAEIFIDGASPHDAKQGHIPDCYVVAAAMAVADAEEEAIAEMIRWVKPGLVEVRLYPVEDGIVGSPKWFPVSTRFYKRGGELLYGRVPEGHQLELWFPIIEKAYALMRGGYQGVANAGSVGAMMASILGRPNRELWLNENAPEYVLEQLKRGLEERRAIAAGTFPANFNVDYSRSLITDSHAYAILDVVEKDGEPHILMLDPWAKGGDPDRNDGVRTVPFSEFATKVQVVNIC
jgi:hypothetical protein